MKTQAALSAILFAAFTALSAGAFAADADKAPAEAPAKKAPAKKMKPHSHMEEKSGAAASMSKDSSEDQSAPADKATKADKDKTKHYHPRDGK